MVMEMWCVGYCYELMWLLGVGSFGVVCEV